jgi:hypothetical protein
VGNVKINDSTSADLVGTQHKGATKLKEEG